MIGTGAERLVDNGLDEIQRMEKLRSDWLEDEKGVKL